MTDNLKPPAKTLAVGPSTDDVLEAIDRLTLLAQGESDPPAITKAMLWSYLHGRHDALALSPPAVGTEPCTLGDCPPGLFRFGEILGFKSEYYARPGVPDAYVVSSGEFFWGGTRGDVAARLALMVTPIEAA